MSDLVDITIALRHMAEGGTLDARQVRLLAAAALQEILTLRDGYAVDVVATDAAWREGFEEGVAMGALMPLEGERRRVAVEAVRRLMEDGG